MMTGADEHAHDEPPASLPLDLDNACIDSIHAMNGKCLLVEQWEEIVDPHACKMQGTSVHCESPLRSTVGVCCG